jgi:hypothetical protein
MLHKSLGMSLFGTSFVKLVNFTHLSEEVQRLVALHGARSASEPAESSFALFETAMT